ncbi:hypothetical protein KQX54_004914 [Cotesia glomerata]|uniref:Uncharacterized protein n=1 Tax=Cotesia glomerata TaxID=32391 RepID=A0AAV7I9G8_COTGL|nr:hypothetical protein KQX54_004914 [Cotesia glomerata]
MASSCSSHLRLGKVIKDAAAISDGSQHQSCSPLYVPPTPQGLDPLFAASRWNTWTRSARSEDKRITGALCQRRSGFHPIPFQLHPDSILDPPRRV